MNAFVAYFLKTAVTLAVFYLFYRFFLRKETFFRFNRYYFLGSIVIALLIPLFDVSFLLPAKESLPVLVIPKGYMTFQQAVVTPLVAPVPVQEYRDPWAWVRVIYLAGVAFFLLRLLWQVGTLAVRIRRAEVRRISGLKIVPDAKVKSPFSFFSWIFVHPDQLAEGDLEEVILHEQEHIRQHHSWDLLLVELLTVFQWPNPFAWLINRSVKETHEYLADRAVLDQGIPLEKYQRTLISFVLGAGNPALITPLNFSLNQKRILMMKKMKSSNGKKWWSLILLPVILMLAMAFSGPGENDGARIEKQKDQTFVVSGRVIDSETGDPVPGVNILVRGEDHGTVSDLSGNFTLKVNRETIPLTFVLNGYEETEKTLQSGKKQVILIKRKDGTAPPPGANHVQTSKKSPLILLDGKEIGTEEMKNLDHDKIAGIEVLKGERAVKRYGEKGRDGVIVITSTEKDQTYKLSGQVLDDATGKPLQGVSVVIVNTSVGAMTGPEGRFTLNTDKPEAEIAFSFVGYQTVRQKVKTGEPVSVRLKKGIIRLDLKDVKAQREPVSRPASGKADDEIFFVVEDVPHFPGELPALKKYLAGHVKYPPK
ncbi:MAG: hypothetical protein DRP97_07820, partial [Candidatus Latescibacterota bacterium]